MHHVIGGESYTPFAITPQSCMITLQNSTPFHWHFSLQVAKRLWELLGFLLR